MLFILLGVLSATFIIFFSSKKEKMIKGIVYAMPVVLVFSMMGLLSAPLGYNEEVLISEVNLVATSINNQIVYVVENNHSFEFFTPISYNGEANIVYTLSNQWKKASISGKVSILENDAIFIGVLKTYKSEGKKSFLSFALNPKISYVFEIPNGTCIKILPKEEIHTI